MIRNMIPNGGSIGCGSRKQIFGRTRRFSMSYSDVPMMKRKRHVSTSSVAERGTDDWQPMNHGVSLQDPSS
jgi:hypothetical protein